MIYQSHFSSRTDYYRFIGFDVLNVSMRIRFFHVENTLNILEYTLKILFKI